MSIFNIFKKKKTTVTTRSNETLSKNILTKFTVACSLCGKEINQNSTISNACFRYCIDCAKKHSISNHSEIKHIEYLFVKEEIPYEICISICIETISGRPCIEFSRAIQGGGGWSSDEHYHEISYEKLKDIAKNTSEELYNKYKDINESNWKEYVS